MEFQSSEFRVSFLCQRFYHLDSGSGLVHSITATSANVHDITEAHKLIRSDDEVVYGDSGYLGIEKREEIKNDKHLSSIDYRINRRPKKSA